jgi:ABC-2 type transport system permease protein
LNPFFYMIDGFRYGFFGQSDTNPWTSLAIVSAFLVVLSLAAIRLLRSGYRLRH